MELAMVKARQSGCGTVAVCHCNHIGFLAYYTMMAAQQGMVGLALCQFWGLHLLYGAHGSGVAWAQIPLVYVGPPNDTTVWYSMEQPAW